MAFFGNIELDVERLSNEKSGKAVLISAKSFSAVAWAEIFK